MHQTTQNTLVANDNSPIIFDRDIHEKVPVVAKKNIGERFCL